MSDIERASERVRVRGNERVRDFTERARGERGRGNESERQGGCERVPGVQE